MSTKRYSRALLRVVGFVVVLAASQLPAAAWADTAPQLNVGDVLGQAQLIAGRCVITDPIGVGAFLRSGDPSLDVQWIYNSSCTAIVSAITRDGTSTSTAPAAGGLTVPIIGAQVSENEGKAVLYCDAYQHIRAYVKYTILEQFGVTATETANGMTWDRCTHYGYFLVNGKQDSTVPNEGCYGSSFPSWTILSCTYALTDDHSTSYPNANAVNHYYLKSDGHFHHTTGVDYTMHSEVLPLADQYDRVFANCELTQGSRPPFWTEDCNMTIQG